MCKTLFDKTLRRKVGGNVNNQNGKSQIANNQNKHAFLLQCTCLLKFNLLLNVRGVVNPTSQLNEVFATFSRRKTCNLFFRFWIRFWCNCLRREQFSSLKFGSNFYKQSLISACFPCNFLFEFEQKIIAFLCAFWCKYLRRIDLKDSLSTADPSPKFGLGDAITFGVTIFRASISARISTKNHRFWRAFWCNYLRRVDFFVVPFLNEFRQKKHRFGCAFWCNYLRRVDFLWFNFCSNFDENSLMFDFVWIHTKNHWFWRAFWCNYLRRVDFLCLYFGSNSDEKSSIFAWFLMLLPAACWFFRGSIFALISTKNHRF